MAAPYTLPEADDKRFVAVRTRYLRRTARLLLDWPHPLPAWLGHAYAGVRAPLGDVLARHPGALYGALLLPQVGGPLHAGDLAEAVPQLLLELARSRVLGAEGIWWHGPVSRLLSPPLGAARVFVPPRAGMLFLDGAVEVAPSDTWALGPVAPARFHRLAEGGWLAEADNNPLAMVDAHPDKAGNALSLGDATVPEWVASLDEARRLVRVGLPALADEHRSLLATVVPVGGPSEVSLSASYQEVVGLVYVSLHPSPLTMAEALVHELQHNKLNLLAHVDPVLADRGETLHASPVRPDPRPLLGVLLAAHAMLPVVALHRALDAAGEPVARTETARERVDQLVRGNREAMDVVRAHARPTELGRALVEGMDLLERAQHAGVTP
jgi:HEXXH motif-containing protein